MKKIPNNSTVKGGPFKFLAVVRTIAKLFENTLLHERMPSTPLMASLIMMDAVQPF
jgi:hypothetical protein